MKRAYVDANVILRLITGDPPEMAAQAESLFQRVDEGAIELLVEPVVVAEVVWVLSSFYGFSAHEIASVVQTFLISGGVISDEKLELLQALALYENKNIDFVDALLAVKMMKQGVHEVYSFDKHFDRLESIRRMTPG